MKLEEQLLQEIGDSLQFSESNIFTFCIDNDCDIATVTNALKELIDENRITKLYYSPTEERYADEPIGEDSFEVFILKYAKMTTEDIDILMQGI